MILATDNAEEVAQEDLQAGLVMAEMERSTLNGRVRTLHEVAGALGVELTPVTG